VPGHVRFLGAEGLLGVHSLVERFQVVRVVGELTCKVLVAAVRVVVEASLLSHLFL
jgi:hypothetical protein